VTVIERDDTPMPASADEAFEWNRRGRPDRPQSPAPNPKNRAGVALSATRARQKAGSERGLTEETPLVTGVRLDDGSELDTELAGEDPYGDALDPRAFTRSVLRDGLAPALRSDQVVLRAFVRNLNLLSPPDALLTDADFGARVFAVLQTKDQRPPEPSLGPATRADFLDSLPAA
jgi:hypothetical protein